MRAHAHGIDFVLLLISDPGIDEIFFENSSFEEELVIRFESREPVPVTLDGELTSLATPIETRVVRGGLRILGAAA